MSEWSDHVKRYAKKHKISYQQANTNPNCKESYRKKRMSPRSMKMPGGGVRGASGPRGDIKGRDPSIPPLNPEFNTLNMLPTELQQSIFRLAEPLDMTGGRSLPLVNNRVRLVNETAHSGHQLKRKAMLLAQRYPDIFGTEEATFQQIVRPVLSQYQDFLTNSKQLAGAGLSGADLSGADLRDTDLSEADLKGADLTGADLTGAYLYGVDLSGADLRGADLRGADLTGAYLYGARLRGAYLGGADLRYADLENADLKGVNLEVSMYGRVILEGARVLEAYRSKIESSEVVGTPFYI